MSFDLSSLARELALRHSEHVALIGAGEQLTYGQLDQQATRWARSFLGHGFGPGTRIGLLAGNSPEWMAVAFGAWRAGATLVPISTFVTARELGEILAHADIDVLVLQPRLRHHDYLSLLDELPSLPALRAVVLLHTPRHPAYRTQAAWLAEADATLALPQVNADDVAALLYTSGTTGTPKGVILAHGGLMATIDATVERGGLDQTDSLLSSLPLFWVAGLFIRALPTLASGCALILLESFSPDAAIAALEEQRPTALHLRPPQVGQILTHPDFRADLLARIVKGGGRSEWFAPHLEKARLITGYGMTEMSGYVTALHWRDPDKVRATQIGSPLPGVEIRIVDPDGNPCAAGQPGEIRVRGPGLFRGYHKQPEGSGLDGGGFFCTGDLGSVDTAGVFHFVGRSKELLRVKGINVSPREVEAVLAAHPQVEAAYVVGVPDAGLDQQVVACIVPRGARPSESDLRELAAQALSSYKRPAHYLLLSRDEVPFGGTSKPQRSLLTQLAIQRLPGLRGATQPR